MEFAVVNSSKTLSDVDCEYMVVACQQQAVEFCQAYGLDPPAAALYRDVSKLPVDDVWICEVTDTLDEPSALGYHSDFGNRPYIRVLAQGPQTSITLSHEFLELLLDPTCDRWVPKGDGTEEAVESADPVQADSYPVIAEIGGEGRTVEVSNYVLPSYWDRTQTGPTNRMGYPLEPFGTRPGGYQVVLERNGTEVETFGRCRWADDDGQRFARERLNNPTARINRRLKGKLA